MSMVFAKSVCDTPNGDAPSKLFYQQISVRHTEVSEI
jgi:hypothetical protein